MEQLHFHPTIHPLPHDKTFIHLRRTRHCCADTIDWCVCHSPDINEREWEDKEIKAKLFNWARNYYSVQRNISSAWSDEQHRFFPLKWLLKNVNWLFFMHLFLHVRVTHTLLRNLKIGERRKEGICLNGLNLSYHTISTWILQPLECPKPKWASYQIPLTIITWPTWWKILKTPEGKVIN